MNSGVKREWFPLNLREIIYIHSLQPFWHQGLVLRKTIFPWTGGQGMVSSWFKCIAHNSIQLVAVPTPVSEASMQSSRAPLHQDFLLIYLSQSKIAFWLFDQGKENQHSLPSLPPGEWNVHPSCLLQLCWIIINIHISTRIVQFTEKALLGVQVNEESFYSEIYVNFLFETVHRNCCPSKISLQGLLWWFSDWLHTSSAEGPGSIPGQGIRSHVPQLRDQVL